MDSRSVRRAAAGVLLLVVAAFVWPQVAPEALLHTDFLQARQPPSGEHLFGTDSVGADLGVQIARGLQVSILVAAGSAAVATLLGMLVGGWAAVAGGRTDRLLMRATDACAGLPALLATVVVVALFRGSVTAVVVALAVTHWPQVARVVRSSALQVMASDYVAVARVAGASRWQIVRHHVLSATAGQAGIAAVMLVPHAVWHESTLSFLGVGLRPETASIGTLIAVGRPGLLAGQWWPVVFPAAALIVVTGACWMSVWNRLDPSSSTGVGDIPSAVLETPERPPSVVVEHLSIRLADGGRRPFLLDEVDLHIPAGCVTAIIGESGAGKTTLGHALCGIAPAGTIVTGTIARHGRAGHLPQHAADSFTPTRRIGPQIAEVIDAHHTGHEVPELLHDVGLDQGFCDRYPHELSGGQARRAALAAALAADPAVLVVDEPTAGLDPESAGRIWRLLAQLASERGAAVVALTHDLAGLAADNLVDRIAVLHAGRIVDTGPAGDLLAKPMHPYTRTLLAAGTSRPRAGARPPAGEGARLEKVAVQWRSSSAPLALPNVAAPHGQVTAITGPSGSGKTTAAKVLSGLVEPASGAVTCAGAPVRLGCSKVAWMPQDPAAAFDPRMTLGRSIALAAGFAGYRVDLDAMAERVHLDPEVFDRTVGEVSGGQAQRAALARALAQRPEVLVVDEPTAHLDAVTGHAMGELVAAQAGQGVAVVVCTHDRALVDRIADTEVISDPSCQFQSR